MAKKSTHVKHRKHTKPGTVRIFLIIARLRRITTGLPSAIASIPDSLDKSLQLPISKARFKHLMSSSWVQPILSKIPKTQPPESSSVENDFAEQQDLSR